MRITLLIWLVILSVTLLVVPLHAFAIATTTTAITNKNISYLQTITNWLDKEEIPWQIHEHDLFSRKMTTQPVLEVGTSISNKDNTHLYYLHIIKSPSDVSECVEPSCARDMTNYVQYINNMNDRNAHNGGEVSMSKISLIHLHEDVWRSKMDIVQNRLRVRLGGPSSRIYARKTMARRIDANTAIPFLQHNHLWSATKARYYYGLYLPSKEESDEILVAVATFSSKRNILYNNEQRRCHELLRFCTQSNGTVVGGITKLIAAFVNDMYTKQPVDHILTVIDRDWGSGGGWHSIGFDTLCVMAPLLMVIKSGVRRHLVGAMAANDDNVQGDCSNSNKTNRRNKASKQLTAGRPGIETRVLDELAHLGTHREALQCLEKHKFYPVYDAGVERLLMSVPTKQSSEDNSSKVMCIVPSAYAPTYRTANTGISALLGLVVAQTASLMYGRSISAMTAITPSTVSCEANINKDSTAAQHDVASWQSTRGTARNAKLRYTTPSSLDSSAMVEVRERLGGWGTIGIAGGVTKSIYHGNFKRDAHGGVDSSVLVHDYLRSMAAVALSAMEFCQTSPGDIEDADSENKIPSFLHLGYGAGSLPRFMSSVIPNSHNVAIELDDGVVRAAHETNLLSQSVELKLGDALSYQIEHDKSYDAVFVDIFDGDNLLPEEFYSKAFLERIRQSYLGSHPNGMVIHNFHTGGKARAAQLADAVRSYRRVFSTTMLVESLNSHPTGGNAILLAMNKRRLDASSETLCWHIAGRRAQDRFGINFDILARTTNKLWFS